MRHIGRTAAACLVTLLLCCPTPVLAGADIIRLAGFVDVPPKGQGGVLSLPLSPGSAPVTILVSFGIPSVEVPVQVIPDTIIGAGSVTLGDGDRVKIEVVVTKDGLQAAKLEVEAFPELDLSGTVQDLPTDGAQLPLPPAGTLDFTLSLGASKVSVPVRVTGDTRISGPPFTLLNGDAIEITAIVRDSRIVATELKGD